MVELWVPQRKLGGAFSVDECARRLMHYRYAEVEMMRALLQWIATQPQVHHKVEFGPIAYHCAQHADMLGKRLPELRVTEGGRGPLSAHDLTQDGPAQRRVPHVHGGDPGPGRFGPAGGGHLRGAQAAPRHALPLPPARDRSGRRFAPGAHPQADPRPTRRSTSSGVAPRSRSSPTRPGSVVARTSGACTWRSC